MEPAAAATGTSPPTWRGMVRRRSQAWDERERVHRRVEELEVEVVRLRAEKKAAERAAVALTAELEAEQGAAETAATEAMTMIGRLQREKSAAMIEAREFWQVAEIRAARERELHDRLAEACALAASYQALLRTHGIYPDGGKDKAKGAVMEDSSPTSSSLPAVKQSFEDKYPVDVRWRKPVAGERVITRGDLRARVEALEADSAAVRREVAALRAESAQQAVPARRRPADGDDGVEKQQGFSVLTVFMVVFYSAVVLLPNIMGNETVCICGKEAPKHQLITGNILPRRLASTPDDKPQGHSADSEQN